MENSESNKHGLKRIDIFLGLICAVFFIDTISPVAAMGPTAITWTIIIAALFFFPGSLTVAEMGAAYPENGGFYAWIKRAYGVRWGARISWIYWSCNAIWISSVATLVINVFCAVFAPEAHTIVRIVAYIVTIWLMVLIASLPMKNSTFVINFSAIVKLSFAILLVVAAIIFLFRNDFTPSNNLSLSQFVPTYGQAMIFIPALIYNFLGFESMSAASSSMKNPARDVPMAALSNALVISVLYIFAVLAVLIILPQDNINIIQGIIDTFTIGFGDSPIAYAVIKVIGVLFVLVLFSQGMMWILTVCRVAAETANNNEFPKVFAKENKFEAPSGSLIIAGIIATAMTILAATISGSAEEMFWSIFSCTSILLLIPYLLNFEAFLKLRKYDTTTPRPYTFPGPKWFISLLVRIAQIIILFTILFFIWVPGQPFNVSAGIFIIVGIIATLGIGELITYRSMKKAKII